MLCILEDTTGLDIQEEIDHHSAGICVRQPFPPSAIHIPIRQVGSVNKDHTLMYIHAVEFTAIVKLSADSQSISGRTFAAMPK